MKTSHLIGGTIVVIFLYWVYQAHTNPGVAGGVSWGQATGTALENFHLGNWFPFGRKLAPMPTGGVVIPMGGYLGGNSSTAAAVNGGISVTDYGAHAPCPSGSFWDGYGCMGNDGKIVT